MASNEVKVGKHLLRLDNFLKQYALRKKNCYKGKNFPMEELRALKLSLISVSKINLKPQQ